VRGGGHIDWAALRRTLAEGERKLAAALVLDDARRLALLRKRADHLAGRQRAAATSSALEPALIFLLGQERYALALSALCQVVPLDHLVPVAGAPPNILGVMSLRGEVGTVWSLAGLLGLAPAEPVGRGHVLILKASADVGLRVDEVEGTRDLDLGAVIRTEAAAGPLSGQFCRGLIADGTYLLDDEALRRVIVSGQPDLASGEGRSPGGVA
jgi:purine-binding chemotaxis protein CheW